LALTSYVKDESAKAETAMNARITFAVLMAAVAILGCCSHASGQTFEIVSHVIAGGGGTSTGGAFSLSGTIGQHDAGPASGPMTGVSAGGVTYALTGGFWAGAVQTPPPCPADFNGDGFVNPDDLSDFITCFFLQVQFPGTCPDAEFNEDGFVNPDDLSDFITAFFLAVQLGC
jgi:hypothetical protein